MNADLLRNGLDIKPKTPPAKLAYIKAWQKRNPEKFKAYMKKSAIKNRDKKNAYRRAWYAGRAEHQRALAKQWRDKNPEKTKMFRAKHTPEQRFIWQRTAREKAKRLKTNRYFSQRLSLRVLKALHGNYKSSPTLVLLGCSIELFRLYLQNQFRDGMAWNNHGTLWEIDHIRPCASFDLSKPEEQGMCFHYSNMQPLLKVENRLKGAKYEHI